MIDDPNQLVLGMVGGIVVGWIVALFIGLWRNR
jgi:hypothetical protein